MPAMARKRSAVPQPRAFRSPIWALAASETPLVALSDRNCPGKCDLFRDRAIPSAEGATPTVSGGLGSRGGLLDLSGLLRHRTLDQVNSLSSENCRGRFRRVWEG